MACRPLFPAFYLNTFTELLPQRRSKGYPPSESISLLQHWIDHGILSIFLSVSPCSTPRRFRTPSLSTPARQWDYYSASWEHLSSSCSYACHYYLYFLIACLLYFPNLNFNAPAPWNMKIKTFKILCCGCFCSRQTTLSWACQKKPRRAMFAATVHRVHSKPQLGFKLNSGGILTHCQFEDRDYTLNDLEWPRNCNKTY